MENTCLKHLLQAAVIAGNLAFSLGAAPAKADPEVTFSGSATAELTHFLGDPLHAGQRGGSTAAFVLKPRLELRFSDELDMQLIVMPYLRASRDAIGGSDLDLREAKLEFDFGATNLKIGYDHVFWGKTESGRLVDIVNQKDLAAGSRDADKLGQFMIAASHTSDLSWGTLTTSAFYMPQFRERRFGNVYGRNRGALVVDGNEPLYLGGGSKHSASYALRFDLTAKALELGVSIFRGMSRDPGFVPNAFGTALRPVYGEITQVGLDGQITLDSVLFKLEAIHRNDQMNRAGQPEDYSAYVLGAEYTISGIAGSNADLGLLLEYAEDSRGQRAMTPLENDFVLGARLALNNTNDTSALAILTIDRKTQEKMLHIEVAHRLSDTLSAKLEGAKILDPVAGSLLYDSRNDGRIALSLVTSW